MRAIVGRTLWAALIIQVGVLSVTLGRGRAVEATPTTGASLGVGDVVLHLAGRNSSSEVDTVYLSHADRWTLVLAYDSKCRWCQEVAPVWERWLAQPPSPVRTVALTVDDPPVAEAFRAAHGWNTAILSIGQAGPRDVERIIGSKTPWLYLFDRDGRLVMSRHGSEVSAVDSVVRGGRGL